MENRPFRGDLDLENLMVLKNVEFFTIFDYVKQPSEEDLMNLFPLLKT